VVAEAERGERGSVLPRVLTLAAGEGGVERVGLQEEHRGCGRRAEFVGRHEHGHAQLREARQRCAEVRARLAARLRECKHCGRVRRRPQGRCKGRGADGTQGRKAREPGGGSGAGPGRGRRAPLHDGEAPGHVE
jgi:hypothetical protein